MTRRSAIRASRIGSFHALISSDRLKSKWIKCVSALSKITGCKPAFRGMRRHAALINVGESSLEPRRTSRIRFGVFPIARSKGYGTSITGPCQNAARRPAGSSTLTWH